MSPDLSAIPCAMDTASSPLDLPESIVEYPVQQHPAQADLQFFGIEVGVPFALGPVIVVEHTDEVEAQVFDILRSGVDRWFLDGACR
jgi:hypothetical protein